MGEEVQISPELELEERDRAKIQARILAMGPVDTKVLALEERLGGEQISRNSCFVGKNIGTRFGSGEVKGPEAASGFKYMVLSKALGARES